VSRRVWVPPPPGPDDPHPCHCAGGWFNPGMYDECKRCRAAYVAALRAVRAVFPGARIIASSRIPLPQTLAGERPAGEENMSEHITTPEPTIDQIEAYIERMEGLVGRWRAMEEPLAEILNEMHEMERQEAGS
jgi:hypothetical protein